MPNEEDAMDTGSGRPTQLGEQDHTECNRRIGELEAQVAYKDIELQNELRRVELLSKTVKGLREEFQKKGVGRSLDERLRQLGLIGTSSDKDVPTSASDLSNWYGSCGGVL